MAKQTINLGTSANDRTGTNLRAAFDICNDNFSELYGYYTVPVIDSNGILDNEEELVAVVGTPAANGAGWHCFVKTTYLGADKKYYSVYSNGNSYCVREFTAI